MIHAVEDRLCSELHDKVNELIEEEGEGNENDTIV